jgi:hypothetical protein
MIEAIPLLSQYPFWARGLFAFWVILTAICVIVLIFARPVELVKPAAEAPVASGGRAEVTGNRSGAIGGSAGESGIVPGGPGGDAIVQGDDSLAIGGQGGGAPQSNGKGGRGGLAALGLGYNTIMPDGHRLSDFGRGGAGANTEEYDKTNWPPLSIDEMITIYPALRLVGAQQVHIMCADDGCLDLAESLVDFFGRLMWPEATITHAPSSNN